MFANRIKNKLRNIDPGILFVPGLIGVPFGAVYGGYLDLNDESRKNKKMTSQVAGFTVSVVAGSILGGIMGSIWVVSLPSYLIINILAYSKDNETTNHNQTTPTKPKPT